jgi:multicomponent Na+:H+ antiporter subunit F
VSPFLLGFTLVVTALIALGLRRVWAGPTVFDRLVAVALVTVNGVVVLVLLGFLFERPVFFLDIALAYALLAFILPIAVSRYFEGRRPNAGDPAPRGGHRDAASDREDGR